MPHRHSVDEDRLVEQYFARFSNVEESLVTLHNMHQIMYAIDHKFRVKKTNKLLDPEFHFSNDAELVAIRNYINREIRIVAKWNLTGFMQRVMVLFGKTDAKDYMAKRIASLSPVGYMNIGKFRTAMLLHSSQIKNKCKESQ